MARSTIDGPRVTDVIRQARELARKNADSNAPANGAMKAASDALDQAERRIGEHPHIALGIAFAAGVLLGWWTKR